MHPAKPYKQRLGQRLRSAEIKHRALPCCPPQTCKINSSSEMAQASAGLELNSGARLTVGSGIATAASRNVTEESIQNKPRLE